MKFTVGYQIMEDDSFLRNIISQKEHIHEVYFAWGSMKNGRNSQLNNKSFTAIEALDRQKSELSMLSREGIQLNLLLNGNCYGAESQSRALFCEIGDTVDFIKTSYGLSSITTTSPLIAKFIKANFPELEVRASVNMSIGTTEGMDYVSDLFDGFYLKRELNRNIPEIKRIKAWCESAGKRLYMLANSGCLNNCSAHTFHDNLVSHESEIAKMDNAYEFTGICHEYLKNPEHLSALVKYTNYIRPEDMHLYDGLFTAAKLATRVNPFPSRILNAYVSGRYGGALTELTEPDHSASLENHILDNAKFPKDFGEHTAFCNKKCDSCGYCEAIFNNALTEVSADDMLI